MSYLTLSELSEFVHINVSTVRVFLEHFTLVKHTRRLKIPTKLTNHNPPHACKTVRVFNVSEQGIYDLEKYLKMKGYYFNHFENDIKEFCKLKRASDA